MFKLRKSKKYLLVLAIGLFVYGVARLIMSGGV